MPRSYLHFHLKELFFRAFLHPIIIWGVSLLICLNYFNELLLIIMQQTPMGHNGAHVIMSSPLDLIVGLYTLSLQVSFYYIALPCALLNTYAFVRPARVGGGRGLNLVNSLALFCVFLFLFPLLCFNLVKLGYPVTTERLMAGEGLENILIWAPNILALFHVYGLITFCAHLFFYLPLLFLLTLLVDIRGRFSGGQPSPRTRAPQILRGLGKGRRIVA